MTCPYCGFTTIGVEFGFVSSCPNCTRYFLDESKSNLNMEERRALNEAVSKLNTNVFSKPMRYF